MPQRFDLVLVTLTDEQIAKAKAANGKRKRITHALLCGPYGQMFGTEQQCWKYYATWREIFPELFEQAYEVDEVDSDVFENDFDSTDDLVVILGDEAERRAKPKDPTIIRPSGWSPGDREAGCLVLLVLWCSPLLLAFCLLLTMT